MYRKIAFALVLASCVVAVAQDRVSATEKGSIVIWPKIEIRFDANQALIQDTFLSLNNDNTVAVHVTLFYVWEDCDDVIYHDFTLSPNQPVWWSAYSGQGTTAWGFGAAPFFWDKAPIQDPEGSTDLLKRGYAIAIATNAFDQPIMFNHLYGGATIVNTATSDAWEYNGYTFQALTTPSTDGVLNLNGSEYDYGFDELLLDFFASGSQAFSFGGQIITHDTDLTLMILDQDLRQETEGPFYTKANFSIWNENEGSFAHHYCLYCWDQSLLSSHLGAFMAGFLHTDKARARINGVAWTGCDQGEPNDPDYIPALPYSLLGVQAKVLSFDTGAVATAGSNLFGAGTQAATIYYDVDSGPPPTKSNMIPTQAPVKKVH